MENEELVGKEFICFEFPDTNLLSFSSTYQKHVGLPATVININTTYPEYANCKVFTIDDGIQEYHYPTKLIKQQLEEKETIVDIDTLIEQYKNLIH